MSKKKAFRLKDRIGQVISGGHDLMVFDVSNTWSYDGGSTERGRIRGTNLRVERDTGDMLWHLVDVDGRT